MTTTTKITGSFVLNKLMTELGMTLPTLVKNTYANALQNVINKVYADNPTASEADINTKLDQALVNQLMKFSAIRNEMVKYFDENGDGKITTIAEIKVVKAALNGSVDNAQADVANGTDPNATSGQTFTLTANVDAPVLWLLRSTLRVPAATTPTRALSIPFPLPTQPCKLSTTSTAALVSIPCRSSPTALLRISLPRCS